MRLLYITLFFTNLFYLASAQKDVSLQIAAGALPFADHKLTGFGLNGALKVPFLNENNRTWFVQLGSGVYAAEGNRNFQFDPSRNDNFLGFDTPFRSRKDVLVPENALTTLDMKTSQSTFFNLEFISGVSFPLVKDKLFGAVGAGVYLGRVTQYFVLETIQLTELDQGAGVSETFEIHVPFSQVYSLFSYAVNLELSYKLSEKIAICTFFRSYGQPSPIRNLNTFNLGVNVFVR
ncbi:MAG: hypothetical protein ACXITV_06210 [Luteibaculaceae bacterium]